MAWGEREAHDEFSLRFAAQNDVLLRANSAGNAVCCGPLRGFLRSEVSFRCRILSRSTKPFRTTLPLLIRRTQLAPSPLLFANFGRWCGGIAVSLPSSRARCSLRAFSIALSRPISTRRPAALNSAPRRSPRSASMALKRRFQRRFFPHPSHWKHWPAFCAATGLPGA